jgi:hypothetical protein
MQFTQLLRRIALVAVLMAPGIAAAVDQVYICYMPTPTASSDVLKVCTASQTEIVLSFSVSGNIPVAASGVTTGTAAGKALFDALTIQKRVSDLSSNLLNSYNTQRQFQTILISVEAVTPTPDGAALPAPTPILNILLKNVYVHDWSWTSDDEYLLAEKYTFDFRTIEIYDATTKTTVTWDVPLGTT